MRNHIVATIELPSVPVKYHRTFYQVFTLKKTLDKLQKDKDNIHSTVSEIIDGKEENTEGSKPKRVQGKGTILLPKQCLFCKKDKTKNRVREPLALLRAEKSIRSAAKAIGDFVLLDIPDLIAAETRYHVTCYKQYIKVNYGKEKASSQYKENEKAAYKNVWNSKTLFHFLFLLTL